MAKKSVKVDEDLIRGYMAIIHKRNISIVHVRSKVVYGTCKRPEKCVDGAHEAQDSVPEVVQIH